MCCCLKKDFSSVCVEFEVGLIGVENMCLVVVIGDVVCVDMMEVCVCVGVWTVLRARSERVNNILKFFKFFICILLYCVYYVCIDYIIYFFMCLLYVVFVFLYLEYALRSSAGIVK